MPFGPISTMLAGSSIKFREKSSSTRGRSHWVGQVHSKSAMGLYFCSRAAFRRRRKLRRERSVSSICSSWGSHGSWRMVSTLASSPCRPRRSRRSRKFSRFNASFGGLVLIGRVRGQLFVIAQVGCPHGDVQAGIVRQGDGDRRALTAQGELGIDEVTHGAQVRSVLGERGVNRLRKGIASVGIEQLQQPAGEYAQVHTALGGEFEQSFGSWGGMMQPIECTMCTTGAFVRLQRLDMEGIFDLLGAIEAERVVIDRLVALDDAHPLERGEDLHVPTHMSMRDAVIVQVKAQVRSLARDGICHPFFGGKGIIR